MISIITRRMMLLCLMGCLLTSAFGQGSISGEGQSLPNHITKKLNVLLLTLDDMSYGTTGAEGCKVPGVTPHIDQLASEGILFTHGYVMVPMCGPSRAALLTGRYPHKSGMMGHGNQPPPNWKQPATELPSLTDLLHQYDYRTGAILKYKRSAYLNTWDVTYKELPYGVGSEDRSTKAFYKRTLAFIKEAKAMDKPFFLYANPVDPHHPWVKTKWEEQCLAQHNPAGPYPQPGRKYTAADVEVPSCLPDTPEMKENLVPYYESLHRGDECIGSILKALEDSGMADETLVIFLSDNGMGIPGAKNTLYPHGTRTPMILKWPGKIKAGRVDAKSIVCAIDLMPTVLEACGLPEVKGIEGRSILQVITGQRAAAERKYALTTFDYWGDSVEGKFFPQRSIINKEFCYIWNGYVQTSNGEKMAPMPWNYVAEEGHEDHQMLKERIAYYKEKPVEELFDLNADPGCWNNVVNDPAYLDQLKRFRALLKLEMEQSGDHQSVNYQASK